jgi:aryl-alcohol dehydrogenase-like predicted oxidoreductase
MNTRRFGKTNLEVTPLGFGGAEIGLLGLRQDQANDLLNMILDAGINVIDTAAMYRQSEKLIGNAISGRRDEYVLISKCGTEVDDVNAKAWTADCIRLTIDRALRNLKTDYLDVMLLHSCDLETLERGEALDALVSARDAGKVRFAGYSGDNEAAAYAVQQPHVDVIQTSINICDQRNLQEVLPACRDHDAGVMAKRPVANAAWKKLNKQPGMYQSYAEVYTNRFKQMGLEPGDLGFDGPPDEVWPEIALRFTLSQQGVHTAIIGTTNPTHVRANIAASEKGDLPAEAVDRICATFKQAESGSGETWLGQT